ncbi:MAG: response regulator transcription factor [Leptospiraceae bacterium]|nr:response regulator transcription factor [Leptospiraceae bacterium]
MDNRTEIGDRQISVGVVENDESYIEKIRSMLSELSMVREVRCWTSAEEYWRDRNGQKLDVLLLDIKLPGMDGVELAGRVTVRNPDISIIMLSNLNSDNLIFQALRNGAIGYILKAELRDLGETLQTVLSGGATITPTIAFRVLTSFRKSNPILEARLTEREKQILELMVSGKTIARVADVLGVSVNTVNHHAKSIYRKLNVHNRTELARKAAAAGLLDV